MPNEVKNIFIVGIGGIGVSGMARIFRAQGKVVFGSDIDTSEIIEGLENEGIKIYRGHAAENVSNDIDFLIFSQAVPENNAEREAAKGLNIPQLSYPEALGKMAENYKKVIAVAGTNGKTTTTAMIGWVLDQAGMDPTVVVGSKVLAWNSNARIGGNKYLILEADEYRRAFLNYHPDIAVITNIEADHLDYYRDLEDIMSAFEEFKNNIKPGGIVIGPENIPQLPEDVRLKVPGWFNRANAAAALATCRALGVADDKIKSGLESFAGTWRRFEKVGRVGGTDVISDYAHHPAGITAVLDAALEVYKDPTRILAVFQPHQHNRTKKLFKEFVAAFCSSRVNNIIISEIFDVAGREEDKDQNISSQDLVNEIRKCGKNIDYARDLKDCEEKTKAALPNYAAVIFIGAGDICKVANKLVVDEQER